MNIGDLVKIVHSPYIPYVKSCPSGLILEIVSMPSENIVIVKCKDELFPFFQFEVELVK